VLQVIGLAAKHDLVLETGHSAPREALQIIAEAKRQRVKHVVVTHAMSSPGGSMTLSDMRQAARLGALLELVYSPLTDEQLQKEAEAIRTIGAASFILSSDLGQPQNPLHTDGLLAMYRGLMAKGIPAADIDLMSRKNPARLLGLDRRQGRSGFDVLGDWAGGVIVTEGVPLGARSIADRDRVRRKTWEIQLSDDRCLGSDGPSRLRCAPSEYRRARRLATLSCLDHVYCGQRMRLAKELHGILEIAFDLRLAKSGLRSDLTARHAIYVVEFQTHAVNRLQIRALNHPAFES